MITMEVTVKEYVSMLSELDKLESLQAENAKLWKLGEQYEVVIADYRSEIVKLRELVRDFARYMPGDCQHCGYAEQCTTRQTSCYKVSRDLHCRARELRVEVDE